MPQKYAKDGKAWGECQRSGKRVLLKRMRNDGQIPNLRVAPDWYEPKHPQEHLPPVDDPVALRHPAPENDLLQALISWPNYDVLSDHTFRGSSVVAL